MDIEKHDPVELQRAEEFVEDLQYLLDEGLICVAKNGDGEVGLYPAE